MKKEEQPRLTTARDSRGVLYKYYKVAGDKDHRFTVPAGRCHKCNKITDAFCDKCQSWICENHLVKGNEDNMCFCLECKDV